jgi:uncharacterized protein YjbI with pentapeptide repeats
VYYKLNMGSSLIIAEADRVLAKYMNCNVAYIVREYMTLPCHVSLLIDSTSPQLVAYIWKNNGAYLNMSGVQLLYANLSNISIPNAILPRANLHGADLSNADLSCADLSNADLSCADLSGANLSGANLYSASLKCAILEHANLEHANLVFANLVGAKMSGVNALNARMSFITI